MTAGSAMSAGYCTAMAVASKLVPLCPCCGDEVRISRLAAAVAWAVVAGALLAFRGLRFPIFGVAALLSGVQVANFWQQFQHDERRPSSMATWVVGAAAAGFVLFALLAMLARRKAASK